MKLPFQTAPVSREAATVTGRAPVAEENRQAAGLTPQGITCGGVQCQPNQTCCNDGHGNYYCC